MGVGYVKLADIHCHALYGVDDGANNIETSLAIIKKEYDDGVRLLCLTPHYNPGFFGEFDKSAAQAHFAELEERCSELYPDLRLFYGNELCYHVDCVDAISKGECCTLADTQYVLVDFHGIESAGTIKKSLMQLFSSGYIPILAHVERYNGFFDNGAAKLIELVSNGILVQVNAESVLKEKKSLFKPIRRCISKGLISFVASDAHNMESRKPMLAECRAYLESAVGKAATQAVLYGNAAAILPKH